MHRKFRIPAMIAFWATVALAPISAQETKELTIGSKAPELNIEHWVQDGGGRFKPVKKFESGKVYVVEFWATWCGPCRQSMPHLAAIQEKFASQGVQIVSVSDEDLETVQDFLKTKVPTPRGAKPDPEGAKTYGELTATYCLTTDPDGSSSKDYLEAASQNGIPAAFIVGKSAQIEWIGHPMMGMDEVLQKVVDGKWDREAFAADFKEEQAVQKAMAKFSALMQRGKTEEALSMLDSLLATVKNPDVKGQLSTIRFQIMMQDKKLIEKLPEAVQQALESSKGNPNAINEIAWMLYEGSANGLIENKELLKVALKAAEASVEKAAVGFKASMMDTIAHLHHELGDKKKALEIQQAAIAIATPEEKASLQGFLDELKEELNAGK